MRPEAKAATALLYISDGQNVYVYDQAGKGQKPIGTLTGFSDAFGLAVAPSGDLYVVDMGQDAIDVFHQGYTTPYETLTGAAAPAGVAIDSAGNVYTNNYGSNIVYIYAGGATYPTSTLIDAPGYDKGGTNFMAVDAAGDVFVDYPSGQIDEFPAGSTYAVTVQTGLSNPEGMAFDGQQNLVVSNLGIGFNIYAPPYTGKPAKAVKGRYEMRALAFNGDDSGLWMAVTNHKYGEELSYPTLKVVEKTSAKYLSTNVEGIATYPAGPI